MADVHNIDRVTTQRIATKIGPGSKEGKQSPSSPIGIFDSGVGGLTVFRELQRQLPNEDIIYIADTARVPYGGRSPQEIIKINHQIINYLIKQGVKLIIMACGTSSAIAYPVVKDEYKTGIISLIGPGSRAAIQASRNGYVGVIATVGTIESEAYQKRIVELHSDAEVTAVATPLLVPLVEGGFIDADETRRVLKEYLAPIIEKGCDTLILGCTHYPHLAKLIKAVVGPGITLVDPAIRAVEETKKLLTKRSLLKDNSKPAKYTFLVTGSVVQFQDLGSKLMGKPIIGAKQVRL
ncbi:MAG: glutamate racemase [Candidatus Margulisbacteria bacterium]|nr:glutamate racemase [Candidatus Margulisiibacteriota bacterium]MBU1021784.1 glutamate racemase [Candidatus Margulisiibacteriota bacterium]MBU1729530.1 glutamate racemase [Candidatus Margulisiibacteriota bacterium]MBU1955369.1 glutamate racemase [Candidatus Margulisiibacteriota bacterium]